MTQVCVQTRGTWTKGPFPLAALDLSRSLSLSLSLCPRVLRVHTGAMIIIIMNIILIIDWLLHLLRITTWQPPLATVPHVRQHCGIHTPCSSQPATAHNNRPWRRRTAWMHRLHTRAEAETGTGVSRRRLSHSPQPSREHPESLTTHTANRPCLDELLYQRLTCLNSVLIHAVNGPLADSLKPPKQSVKDPKKD